MVLDALVFIVGLNEAVDEVVLSWQEIVLDTTALIEGLFIVAKKAHAVLLLILKSCPFGVKNSSFVLLNFNNTRKSSGATSLHLRIV